MLIVKIFSQIANFIKLSLAKKLILTYLVVVFFPVAVGVISYYNYTTKSLKTEYLNLVENSIIQIDSTITENVITILQISKSVATDLNINTFLTSKRLTDYDIVNGINTSILTYVNIIKTHNPLIYSVKIIHGNSSIFDVPNNLIYDSKMLSLEWEENMKKMKSIPNSDIFKYFKAFYEGPHLENIYDVRNLRLTEEKSLDNIRKNVYTFYLPIFKYASISKYVGIVETDILQSTLEEPLNKLKSTHNDIILMVDASTNRVIYNSDSSFIFPRELDLIKTDNHTSTKIGNSDYYAVKVFNRYLDCWIIQLVPYQSVYSWKDKSVILVTGGVILFITIIGISWMLSKILLSDLLKLTTTIRKMRTGNFDIKINIKSQDEIGVLATEFNKMTARISQLMLDIEESHKTEKEAIYIALENQIRPHFLSNALDMVRMTAEVGNNHDISQSLETITNYCMYNLSERSKYVKIENELKNLTDYLKIHNMINKNIEFSVKISRELSGKLDKYMMLKFIMQPLAENSIKHGFKSKPGKCGIFIQLSASNDQLTVIIEDNGNGISKEKLEEINNCLHLDVPTNKLELSSLGIGLRNIRDKLYFNFGRDSSLTLESYHGVGTCVTLVMPLIDTK